MTDLYLIAHKVRNEPAFDVAERMTCPCCSTHDVETHTWIDTQGCYECDQLGYWWIIPTSGHRAYPYAHWQFCGSDYIGMKTLGFEQHPFNVPPMPPDLPDHYPHALAPNAPKRNLIDLLNLRPKSTSTTPFPRRI